MSRNIITKRDLPGYFSWPLSISTFNFVDKLRISKFILTEDRWTQGEFVREYEEKWEQYTGCKHAIMVSSGSTANELIALRRKEELKRAGQWPKRNKVIFPVITWISSVSPWLNFDFEPVFVDTSAKNLNSTFSDIKHAIEADVNGEISTVFYTSLLGFSQDLHKIKDLCDSKGIKFLLDNCESSFSHVADHISNEAESICGFVTSSTSFYFSHLTTTGTEGGMIFCKDDEEYEWYKMARSHGMVRGLPDKYRNPDVDEAFDFNILGSNYRSHNLAAFMGLLDFDRALRYCRDLDNPDSRLCVSRAFSEALDPMFFSKPHEQEFDDNVPFCLPIVLNRQAKLPDNTMKVIAAQLTKAGVESRPLISGSLIHQTPFKKYGKPEDFPCAEYLHNNARYVGLFKGVKEKTARGLAETLNAVAKYQSKK